MATAMERGLALSARVLSVSFFLAGVCSCGSGSAQVSGQDGGATVVGQAGTGGMTGLGGNVAGMGGRDVGGSGPDSGGVGGGGVPTACLGPDVDVHSVLVNGTIKIGGAAVSSASDYGSLALRNGADKVELGTTSGGTYSVRMLPGTYDIVYTVLMSSGVAPRNLLGTVRTGVVVGTSETTTLDIDVPVAALSGKIKVTGAMVGSTSDAGGLSLVKAGGDPQNGDRVFLGAASASSYSVRAMPGTYDLYFAEIVPVQVLLSSVTLTTTTVKLKTGVIIPSTGTVSLDIDIPAVTLTGAITLGGVPPTSDSDGGALVLRGAGNDQIFLGFVDSGHYTAQALPGTYDLYYVLQGLATPGTLTPRNSNAKFVAGVVIPAATGTVMNIDVPSAVVSGAITINGRMNGGGVGDLYLRNVTGDEIRIGLTSAQSYSLRVVPGTYDVYYQGATSSPSVPANTKAKIKSDVVVAPSGTTVVDIDVPAVPVTGMMTFGGALETSHAGEGDYGRLYLRTAAGDEVALGTTDSGSYSVQAVPGTYDVFYRYGHGGPLAPRNVNAKVKSGVVVAPSGTTVLDIDVPSVPVAGTVKVGGASSSSDWGYLFLDEGEGDGFELGSTSEGAYSLHVIPGTYDLLFSVATAGALSPRNALGRLGCFHVQ